MAKKTAVLKVVEPDTKAFRGQAYTPLSTYAEGVPTPDAFEDLEQAYALHTWVYAACQAIASNYAGLQWKAYRDSPEGWKEYEKHPLMPLLERPNPYMSGSNLREFIALSLKLTGNTYLALEKNGDGDPTEIWPVPAGSMKAVSTKDKPIDHYIYEVDSKKIKYGYEEIIHLRLATPISFVYGQGSLSAAKTAITTDFYAQTWNKYFFKNSARPDALLETDSSMPEDVKKRVMSMWRNLYQGSDKRAKMAILEGGLKYKEINRNPKDVDFVELRKQAREEVLAAFGVPPVMVGVFEYANYANSKEQIGIFWKHTMLPLVRAIQDGLTMRARQIYYDPLTIFESDTSAVEALRPDEQARSQTALTYWKMGIPLNQLIDKFDLPFDPVEGGDVSTPQTGGGFGAFGAELPEPIKRPAPPAKALPAPRNTALDDAHWKKFDDLSREWEQRMQLSVRGFFRNQLRRVLKKWEQAAPALLAPYISKAEKPKIVIEMIFDSEKEAKRMRGATDEFITGAYVDFATRVARGRKPLFNFKLDDPHTLDLLEEAQLKLVRQATATTLEKLSGTVVDGIRDAVAEGFSQGEAIASVADRINDYYELAMEGRAEMIARTEIHSASNSGSYDGMKASGATHRKWLSSRDAKVRDTHGDERDGLEGQVVEIGQPYVSKSGATLMYPGDRTAPPEEIINCRCNERPVYDDD